jgi:HK97 gp10 family phage protein
MVSAKIQIKVNSAELKKIINQAENLVSESSVYMAEEMKKSITSGAKSGRRYGSHTSSAPGQAPANWTGQLLKSIKVQKMKGISFVYITAKYAQFLEFGTSKMRARPFIIPAFIKTKKYIQDKLKRIAK